MVDFIAWLAALTWASRLRRSATWVPRLTSVIEAWVFDVVSPAARSEIGTAATRLLRGTPPCGPSQRRSAVAHSSSTMSLSLQSLSRALAFSGASGKVMAAKARPTPTLVFNAVRGASVRFDEAVPPLPRSSALFCSAWPAAPASVLTAAGSCLTICTTCFASVAMAPRSISDQPSLKTLLRLPGLTGISRPSGCKSISTWASATAAWPSTAAWCNWV